MRASEHQKATLVRMIWLALSGVLLAISVRAQPTAETAHDQSIAAGTQFIPAPNVGVNDTWTYHHTGRNNTGWHETHPVITVQRAGASDIVVAIRLPGSDLPTVERMFLADWSFERSINGQQMVVNRLDFPLSIGKTWKVEYTENNPNRFQASVHVVLPYKVTGWESATVAAGTFRALKIEADGTWSAVIAPATTEVTGSRTDASGVTTVVQKQSATSRKVSGHLYRAFWYVPAVKRWVKATEETYNGNGVRTEYSVDELESYKVAH